MHIIKFFPSAQLSAFFSITIYQGGANAGKPRIYEKGP